MTINPVASGSSSAPVRIDSGRGRPALMAMNRRQVALAPGA